MWNTVSLASRTVALEDPNISFKVACWETKRKNERPFSMVIFESLKIGQ